MSLHSLSRREFLQTAAVAAAGARAPTSQGRPNIVFLMSDEHRSDALGCAGHSVVRTPNLDRLASSGVHFTHTYCQGPLCQPSRASLITGQYVHQHGQTWNRINMNPEWPTMMRQLQRAGYTNAKVGKAHFAADGTGFGIDWSRRYGLDWLLEEYDRGIHARPGIVTPYTQYLKSKNLLEAYVAEVQSSGQRRGKTSTVPQEHTQTVFLAERAIDWLRNYKSEKPFFLWVSFIDPHPPFIDEARWAERYKDVKIPLGPPDPPAIPENAWGRYLRTLMNTFGSATLTEQLVTSAARHYYGKISLIDQTIGDIVKAVDELGFGKNTWFFYTADHGEMLGDHKLMYKLVFYKGSVLVPNIVRPPGGMAGRTVNGPVESIDITATIMDIAGAELPACRGRSLAPFTKGQGSARQVAHSELAGLYNKGNFFVMAATERYRYVFDKENNIGCELFDLEKDPTESHNLVDEPGYAGIRKDLHKDYVLPFLEDKKS
jgi:arylsulfatase A-like enzyme